jgi:hypothetical protein
VPAGAVDAVGSGFGAGETGTFDGGGDVGVPVAGATLAGALAGADGEGAVAADGAGLDGEVLGVSTAAATVTTAFFVRAFFFPGAFARAVDDTRTRAARPSVETFRAFMRPLSAAAARCCVNFASLPKGVAAMAPPH